MRHGTAGQESATNSGKAGSVKAKTTALALVSLPAGAVPVGDAARESFEQANALVQLGYLSDALCVPLRPSDRAVIEDKIASKIGAHSYSIHKENDHV